MRNAALGAAVHDLVIAARPLLRSAWKNARYSAPHQVRWVIDGDRYVRKAVPSLSALQEFDPSLGEKLAKLPEYQDALTLLLEDRAARRLLGTFVGGPLALSDFSPQRLLKDAVFLHLGNSTELPQEGAIDATWERIEAALYEPKMQYVALAPLIGVAVQGAPVELAPGITLERLSGKDLVRCLEADLFKNMGVDSPTLGYRVVPLEHLPAAGVRITQQYTRRVYKPERFRPADEDSERFWKTFDLADRVLTVLRLYEPEFVAMAGVIQWSDDYFGLGASRRSTRQHTYHRYEAPGYLLGVEDASGLVQLWEALSSRGVQKRCALQLALRRLNMAIDRVRYDDKLVDLMICAEAALLQDINPAERGELRFRLSLRAGRSFPSNEFSPRDIFKLLKEAYDIRSSIVHGGEPKEPRVPGRGKVTLGEFTSVVERVMRQGTGTLVLQACRLRVGESLVQPDATVLSDK